jgi:translation initiation factor 5A
MSTTVAEVRQLREGRYVVVDNEPCKILNISTSKPGKHGGAKARIDCVGIFDGNKRTIVAPVTERVQVPLIDRRGAQVVSVHGEVVQLMDMATYETFELPLTEEVKAGVEPGQEIVYIEAMGRRMITKM